MNTRDEIQQILCDTIERIAKGVVSRTSYAYLTKCKITEVDPLENSYYLDYRGQVYIGFSITGETYLVGDFVYVLFSNADDNFKKMILTRVGTFEDNSVRRTASNALSKISVLSEDIKTLENTVNESSSIESIEQTSNSSNYENESIYLSSSISSTGYLKSSTINAIKNAATIKISFVFVNQEENKSITFKSNGVEILKWDSSDVGINKIDLIFARKNKSLNSWSAFGTLSGETTSVSKTNNISNLGSMTNFSFATSSPNKIEQGVATIEVFI